MKLKSFLALTLAGAVLTVSLTACTPLDAAELCMTGFSAAGRAALPAGTARALWSRRRLKRASLPGWFGLNNADQGKRSEAEPVLQEVAKRFDPGSWYNDNGQLNDTAKAELDKIAKDKLTANGLPKYTYVDVWEVQPRQTDFDPSPNRLLYEDLYSRSGNGATTDAPTHSSYMRSYSVVKSWMQSTYTSNVYAGVFQKNGKTYAAMVIIW